MRQADGRFEEFWSRYGNLLGLERAQVERCWYDAAAYYTDLPYHNFQHALDAMFAAMGWADFCTNHGAAVSYKSLFLAALFHDAGFHEDPEDFGYKNKEERSAAIMQEKTVRYGLAVADIRLAAQAIAATRVGTEPRRLEEKILVRSDLNNLVGDYETEFWPKTLLLRQETRNRATELNLPFDERQFLLNSLQVLTRYVNQDLSLGDFDASDWSRKASRNLDRLASSIPGPKD